MIGIQNQTCISVNRVSIDTDTYQQHTVRNNALHGLTVIELIVIRLLSTESFLTRYSNGHTK